MAVHHPTTIVSTTKRGEQLVEATTGCGETVARAVPVGGSLIDIGLSGWSSQITCPACKTRLGIAD